MALHRTRRQRGEGRGIPRGGAVGEEGMEGAPESRGDPKELHKNVEGALNEA